MADGGHRRGLGTGLGALLESGADSAEREIVTLPISRVEPRESQPRVSFNEEALSELAASIGEYGVIQPLTVRRLDSGYYQIIAGERRWRAARLAGLSEVPVRVVEADDRLATELALVENLQREGLNPMEEARGYRTLIEEYGLTQEEAAQRVGKSRPAVTNALRLLGLSKAVTELVEKGELSAGHARALLPVSDAEAQLDAAQAVIKKGLSVRKTEELAKRLTAVKKDKPEASRHISVDYMDEVSKRLERSLGRKVKLSESGKRGRIVLEYYGADDRERLIDGLSKLKIHNWE